MTITCCKVFLKDGEKIRKFLLDNNLLNKKYKLKKEDDYIYIPIKNIDDRIKNKLAVAGVVDIIELESNFLEESKKRQNTSFRQYLIDNFKNEVKNGLVSLSYDVIGNIAIIQVSDEIEENIRKKIGEIALELIPSAKTVFRRKSNIQGEYRIRDLEHLAGEYNTLTVYKENGYRLWVDVEKVYFSPRLGWERKRIMEKVKPNDIVVDMFCGVGPFSVACKNAKKIYAIDINPSAVELLKKNIFLNRLQNKVVPILDDVRNVELMGNRVIMNLPKYSHLFVDKALELTEKNGIIHYYTIGKNFNDAIKLFKSKSECEILEKRIVKSYSPREYVLVLDIKIKT